MFNNLRQLNPIHTHQTLALNIILSLLFRSQKGHFSATFPDKILYSSLLAQPLTNPRKAPGPDLITARMLQELPSSGLRTLLHILNGTLRLEYWPTLFKQAKVMMILKPGKPPTEVTSYSPISLLPVPSKILEKLLLTRMANNPHFQDWIPSHQFGFKKAHSTVQQCHRITDIINRALEEKNTAQRYSLM